LPYREGDVTITARRRKSRSSAKPPPRVLSVYAGRDRLGAIVETADECSAVGPTGKRLGIFKTRVLALTAIHTAADAAARKRAATQRVRQAAARHSDQIGTFGKAPAGDGPRQ
jgi:hypothetical protein